MYDGLASTRQLTDINGAVTDSYDFYAFGEILKRTGTTDNRFLFTGEQYDPNLGFYFLRARLYNPNIGRFHTLDSFEGFPFDPASLHKYLYCKNNPTLLTDYSGKFGNFSFTGMLMTSLIVGIVAGLLGGGITYYFTRNKGKAIKAAIIIGSTAMALTALVYTFAWVVLSSGTTVVITAATPGKEALIRKILEHSPRLSPKFVMKVSEYVTEVNFANIYNLMKTQNLHFVEASWKYLDQRVWAKIGKAFGYL